MYNDNANDVINAKIENIINGFITSFLPGPNTYIATSSLSLLSLKHVNNIDKKIINGEILTIMLGKILIDRIKTLKTGILFTTIKFNNLVVCNNQDIPINIKKNKKKDFNMCFNKYISIFFIILHEY